MCLQCVECAEKVMKQLATLYRNAKKKKKKKNLLDSNIDVGGTTRWRSRFTGTHVESWVMKGMKNITTMSHNHCMNPLTAEGLQNTD